jgi:formate/nitrite transporter FocA (FNT family)
MRSYSLVVLILLDAELIALAITIIWIQKIVSRNKKWQQYFVVILTNNLQCSLLINKLNDYPQALAMRI